MGLRSLGRLLLRGKSLAVLGRDQQVYGLDIERAREALHDSQRR